MFHDASRECPPRDPRILNQTVTGVDGVFRRIRKCCRSSRRRRPVWNFLRDAAVVPGLAPQKTGALTGGMHEKAQKIWHGSEGQKVGEKRASENRIETQTRG
jgi:hypothetical protein